MSAEVGALVAEVEGRRDADEKAHSNDQIRYERCAMRAGPDIGAPKWNAVKKRPQALLQRTVKMWFTKEMRLYAYRLRAVAEEITQLHRSRLQERVLEVVVRSKGLSSIARCEACL